MEAGGDGGARLCVGPGARLGALRPVLEALSPARVRGLDHLDDLAAGDLDAGTVLLDADLVPLEEVGWLARLARTRPGLSLVLVGDDAGRRSARALLRLANVRWQAWPLDVEDLAQIARGPAGGPPAARAARPPAAAARTTASPPTARRGEDDELRAIEAILGGAEREGLTELGTRELGSDRGTRELPSDRAGREASQERAAREPELELFRQESPSPPGVPGEVPAAGRSERARDLDHRPPRYFRDQVADLADIAQRLELAVEAEASADGPLRGEVARLAQFARTLGYLVAPPPPGEQVFDLAEMVRVLVTDLVARGPDSPRCLMRGGAPATVRSDRLLLGQALDAMFYLVRSAAAAGEVVRVQWAVEPIAREERVRMSIEFPAGPLAELAPAQIVEPYSLRRLLPELGPNALAAAAGIVRGQGGALELHAPRAGRLEWVLHLPRAVEGRQNGSHAGEGAAAAHAEDPFAG